MAFDLDVFTFILPLNLEDEIGLYFVFTVIEKFIDNLLMAQYLTTDLNSKGYADYYLYKTY